MPGEPRDFLDQASNYLHTPKPLSEMLVDDRVYVTDKLLDILRTGGIYERKYAAFALGQIGDESTLKALRGAQDQETKEGVHDAIAAAIAGIEAASIQMGASENDRRRVIQNAYEGLSPFVGKESPVNEKPSSSAVSASKGGCLSLIAGIAICVLLFLANIWS